MSHVHNPNCDGAHCVSATGEVRLLPTSKPCHSNAILCRACHGHEIRWRKERNRELGSDAQFDLTSWESLDVYGSGT